MKISDSTTNSGSSACLPRQASVKSHKLAWLSVFLGALGLGMLWCPLLVEVVDWLPAWLDQLDEWVILPIFLGLPIVLGAEEGSTLYT